MYVIAIILAFLYVNAFGLQQAVDDSLYTMDVEIGNAEVVAAGGDSLLFLKDGHIVVGPDSVRASHVADSAWVAEYADSAEVAGISDTALNTPDSVRACHVADTALNIGDYLKLDQTTPQTVENGAPIFNGGILSNDTVIIQNWATTYLTGDYMIIRKPTYSAGSWARVLMWFQEYDETNYFQMGAYGSNNTLRYGYLGTAYNNANIKFRDGLTAVGLGSATLPYAPFSVGNAYEIVVGYGGTNNVGIGTFAADERLEVSGNIMLHADNQWYYVGTARDAGLTYDGTNMVFNSRLIGSGNYVFEGGTVAIENIPNSESDTLVVDSSGVLKKRLASSITAGTADTLTIPTDTSYLTFADSTDSIVKISGIKYDKYTESTTFPFHVYSPDNGQVFDISKLGTDQSVWLSNGGFPSPDSGAYIGLRGINNSTRPGDIVHVAGNEGKIWLQTAAGVFIGYQEEYSIDSPAVYIKPVTVSRCRWGIGANGAEDAGLAYGGNGRALIKNIDDTIIFSTSDDEYPSVIKIDSLEDYSSGGYDFVVRNISDNSLVKVNSGFQDTAYRNDGRNYGIVFKGDGFTNNLGVSDYFWMESADFLGDVGYIGSLFTLYSNADGGGDARFVLWNLASDTVYSFFRDDDGLKLQHTDSADADYPNPWTGSTDLMVWSPSLIKLYGALDIQYSGISMILGADATGNTRTDNTAKLAKIVSAHYDNDEEPVGLAYSLSDGTNNSIVVGGGGVGDMNAATDISFRTAANATTTGGTERVRIASNGRVGIGTASPQRPLHVEDGLCRVRLSATSYSTPDSAIAYLEFYYKNDDTRLGYVGFPTSANADMYINNTLNSGLRLLTNNTLAIRIDSDQNVGIGTNDPKQLLHIFSTSSGADPFATSKLIIEDASTAGLNFLTENTGNADIFWGDPEDDEAGRVNFDHLLERFSFKIHENEKLKIDTTGIDVSGTINADDTVSAPCGEFDTINGLNLSSWYVESDTLFYIVGTDTFFTATKK